MGIDAKILVKAKRPYSERELRQLACRLMDAVGSHHFSHGENYRGQTISALEIVEEFTQDGDSIFPAPGETFITVNWWARYYGIGYERGPWPIIRAICEWLGHNAGEVWYGGDSSGVCAEPYLSLRDEIDAHWLAKGSFPYHSNGVNLKTAGPECPLCMTPTWKCGWGPGGDMFRCHGCNRTYYPDGSLVRPEESKAG